MPHRTKSASCCPYGELTAVPAILAFVASSLVAFAVIHCNFVIVHDGNDEGGIGFLTYQDDRSGYYGCYLYNDNQKDELFDFAWRFGKALGIVACSIGFLAFLFSVTISCVPFPRQGLRYLACTYFCCAIMSITMLAGLGSNICDEYDCTVGSGAGCAIGAFVCFALTGIFTLCLEERRVDDDDASVKKDETEEEEDEDVVDIELDEHFVVVVNRQQNDDGTETVTTAKKPVLEYLPPRELPRFPSEGLYEVKL